MPEYFSQLPSIQYSKFSKDGKISEYETVKNIFKRGVLREDIFKNLAFFKKYEIIGDERPDQVADKIYDDPTLDWLVLIANNIINVNDQWPMSQRSFDRYLLDKYGSYQNINSIRHFESEEVKNTNGVIILKAGTQIEESFELSYYDELLGQQKFISNIAIPITNYQYEVRLEENKRNIFILKPEYLQVVYDDIENIMTYKKGSTQYISGSLKKADNIRLTD
jgi:hypothetical protein